MNAIVAASTLAEMSGWTLTNLQLQKLLYLGQMFHLGENGTAIFDDDFEAWKLGPVVPSLYRQARMYGDKPVKSLFTDSRIPDGTEKNFLKRTLTELTDRRPWKLVAITHWEKGAWAKHYAEGDFGCVIPKGDILDEYKARAVAHAARAAAV